MNKTINDVDMCLDCKKAISKYMLKVSRFLEKEAENKELRGLANYEEKQTRLIATSTFLSEFFKIKKRGKNDI